MTVRAVVPVKRFDRAKQRLANRLDRAGRAALAAAMLGDVLEQLARADGLAGILVVTADPAAASIAAGFGATVLADPVESGTNDAVARGLRELVSQGAAGAMVVPADIPFVSGAELAQVLTALGQAPVVLVPAARDGGTNLLGLAPPDAIAPSFGPESLARHHAAARHLRPVVLTLAGAGHDIDVPADLAVAAAPGAGSRTIACLDRLGRTARSVPEQSLEGTLP